MIEKSFIIPTENMPESTHIVRLMFQPERTISNMTANITLV